MSEELSDLESIEEHRIQLGAKRRKPKSKKKPTKKEKSEKKEKKEESKKRKKKSPTDNLELMESDSKEYVEEEEESGEIEDSNSLSNSEEEISSIRKKRKLEEDNQVPMWSRTWKENNDNDNNKSESSSAIVVNINKADKNNEANENEKNNENKLINETNEINNLNNSRRTNFFTTSTENNNVNIQGQNKNLFNSNRNNPNNYLSQNNINNPEFLNPENKQYLNQKNNLLNNNKYPFNPEDQKRINPQNRTIQIKIPHIFNGQILCQFMQEKYKKYKLDMKNIEHETIIRFVSENLTKYIRTYLLRLISISRIRNINFNLYSNNPNGQIHYKFHTFNYQLSEDKKSLSYTKGKDLDILFTSNLKKNMDLIEEYVELNNKKLKFEKLSSCKEKDEENDKAKGIESSIKITEGPNPTIKLLPGRRTKKKNNLFIKEVRKKLVQTQKKEDSIKQNANTKDTLDAFLNDNDVSTKNKSKGKGIDSLLDESRMSNKMELSSRMSDNMSNIFSSYTNNNLNNPKNEIDMAIFNNFDATKNDINARGQKRRINLKDFIFLLENSNEFIPKKIFILNKASLEHLNKK